MHFRIISDMTRLQESSPNDAGARLALEIRKIGVKAPIMIFTGNKKKAVAALDDLKVNGVLVTIVASTAMEFITFK